MIPYGHQSVDEDDIAAVVEVLRGEWLTQGPHVEDFEAALAATVDARYAVAFANGTAALHGAAHAAGWGPGDSVATSSLSFVASANCARYVGAKVSFVDVDPVTLNVDPRLVPSGIDGWVAVHFAGLPVDLRAVGHRPRVIVEDAAHALGASTPDGPVGNCAHSDMCVFSFHPVKAVTTGEGGAVTTNSSELAQRLRRFRNHGIEQRPDVAGWFYEVVETAFNYRLSDIHAALGTSQLTKLKTWVLRRNNLAARYDALLANANVELPPVAPPGTLHAYHLYPVRVHHRERIYRSMRRAGVGVQVHYVPIHRQPVFRTAQPPSLPNTDAAYDRLLSLPLYPGLTEAEQNAVVDSLVHSVRDADQSS